MKIEPRFLLDTNVCIYLLEGRSAHVRQRLENCRRGEAVTSAIVHAEVMIGAKRRDRAAAAERLFSFVPVLPFDQAASATYAHLPFSRGNFDRLIAAHALCLAVTLVTNNERDFADIPGLAVENWASPL